MNDTQGVRDLAAEAVQKAIENKADPESLQKIMDFFIKIRFEEDKEELVKKLFRAKKNFKEIKKDSTVSTGMKSYKYADLNTILKCVSGALEAEELVLSFDELGTSKVDDGVVVKKTEAILSYGRARIQASYVSPVEWLGVDDKRMNQSQAYGSALTYSKRYALLNLLGIVADDDDDGQSFQTTDTQGVQSMGEIVPKDYPNPPKQTKNYLEGYKEIQVSLEAFWDEYKKCKANMGGQVKMWQVSDKMRQDKFLLAGYSDWQVRYIDSGGGRCRWGAYVKGDTQTSETDDIPF